MLKGFPKAMKIVVGVFAAILIGEAVFAIVSGEQQKATVAVEQQAPQVAPLKVSGLALEAGGAPVVFRGVSFGWHNLWPRFYNSEAVCNLKSDWGSPIFRASIGADTLHENGDQPGYLDDPESALKCLFAVVDGAVSCGAYVIVDWHSHLIHTEEAKEFFTAVAERYKGVPNVIYELFNEPVCRSFEAEHSYADLGNQEAMEAYWMDLKAYAEELIGVITSIDDSEPLILMGCPCWDQRIDLPAAKPVEGYSNLMYTVHFYAATHKDSLREASDAALAAGLPIFISECAACEATGDGPMDAESWQAWTGWATERGISMLTWSISDKAETCSMFTPEASSEGPWADEVTKPWGKIIKDWLKNE